MFICNLRISSLATNVSYSGNKLGNYETNWIRIRVWSSQTRHRQGKFIVEMLIHHRMCVLE